MNDNERTVVAVPSVPTARVLTAIAASATVEVSIVAR
ncbi:hypothetical protein Rrhod_2343 [Rhodococcus rhodnii LMG 5362]|uniref:Uncharacterized protein n=1 Tax=Rhodococcus rhodnii LMG 5362 TaxID=1273125 RepID=R7WM13_9NOCA|nr:hypothetical protein Rrhod_2343 [Rhodococcus rhodnii LMG 5362]